VFVGLLGCLDNPKIDGSQVPPIDNAMPSCADICTRIAALCGYAPEGDNCTNADASGYCDLNLTSAGPCIAEAGSCAEVWNPNAGGCAYIAPAPDGGDDGPSE
jgi:hypothetical protein